MNQHGVFLQQTSSVGSSVGSVGSAGRMSQVQEQVSRGANIVGRMEEKLKTLFDRLGPVLVDVPPTDAKEAANPRPVLVGHANALSNHNDQLEFIDGALGQIIDRLEL